MFQLELTDHDRLVLIFGLGIAYSKLGETYGDEAHQLYQRVVGLPNPSDPPGRNYSPFADPPVTLPAKSGTDAAAAMLSRPAPAPAEPPKAIMTEKHPAEFETMVMTPAKLARRDSGGKPRTVMTAKNSKGEFVNVSIWDTKLFPLVANRVTRSTTFFVTRSKDGKFINLIGLEA